MKTASSFSQRAFTLIELLIVVTVIAILAGAAFVALNPAQRLQDTRDSTRWQDVTAVLDGAKIDQLDNGGAYHATISGQTAGTPFMIGTATGAACTTAGGLPTCTDEAITDADCVDYAFLATEGYLASVPFAPQASGGTAWDAVYTGYYATRNANNTLLIGACDSENTASISVAK